MISKNYKKIAIIEPNQVLIDSNSRFKENVVIPINTAFKFTKFILNFDIYREGEDFIGQDIILCEKNTFMWLNVHNILLLIAGYNANSVTVTLWDQLGKGAKITLTRIIAIE